MCQAYTEGSHPSQNVTSCTIIPSAIQLFAAWLRYGLYAGAPVWGRGCHSNGIKCKLQLPANQLHSSELWASCTAKHGSPSSAGPKCRPLGTLHSRITVQWTRRRGLPLPGAADWQCSFPKSGPINNSWDSLQRGYRAPPADGVPPCKNISEQPRPGSNGIACTWAFEVVKLPRCAMHATLDASVWAQPCPTRPPSYFVVKHVSHAYMLHNKVTRTRTLIHLMGKAVWMQGC